MEHKLPDEAQYTLYMLAPLEWAKEIIQDFKLWIHPYEEWADILLSPPEDYDAIIDCIDSGRFKIFDQQLHVVIGNRAAHELLDLGIYITAIGSKKPPRYGLGRSFCMYSYDDMVLLRQILKTYCDKLSEKT